MTLPAVYSDVCTPVDGDSKHEEKVDTVESPDITDVGVGDTVRISYIPNDGGIGAQETLTGTVTGEYDTAVEIDRKYWVSNSIVGTISGEKIGAAGMVEARV